MPDLPHEYPHINAYQCISLHINITYHISCILSQTEWVLNTQQKPGMQAPILMIQHQSPRPGRSSRQLLSGLAAHMNQKRWEKHVNAVDFPFHNYQGLKLKNNECIQSI